MEAQPSKCTCIRRWVEKCHHEKNQLCFNVCFYQKSSCLTASGILCLSKAHLGWKWHQLAWESFLSPPPFSGTQQYILGKLNQRKTYSSSTKHQVSRCTRRCDLHCFPQPFAQPASTSEARRNYKKIRHHWDKECCLMQCPRPSHARDWTLLSQGGTSPDIGCYGWYRSPFPMSFGLGRPPTGTFFPQL